MIDHITIDEARKIVTSRNRRDIEEVIRFLLTDLPEGEVEGLNALKADSALGVRLAELSFACGIAGNKELDEPTWKRRYLESEGTGCPLCGSFSIDGGPVTIDDGAAFQDVCCADCGGSWTDRYKLVDVDLLVK